MAEDAKPVNPPAFAHDKLLIVDINGAYTADVAVECARAIEPFGIHWIEEPLPAVGVPKAS